MSIEDDNQVAQAAAARKLGLAMQRARDELARMLRKTNARGSKMPRPRAPQREVYDDDSHVHAFYAHLVKSGQVDVLLKHFGWKHGTPRTITTTSRNTRADSPGA